MCSAIPSCPLSWLVALTCHSAPHITGTLIHLFTVESITRIWWQLYIDSPFPDWSCAELTQGFPGFLPKRSCGGYSAGHSQLGRLLASCRRQQLTSVLHRVLFYLAGTGRQYLSIAYLWLGVPRAPRKGAESQARKSLVQGQRASPGSSSFRRKKPRPRQTVSRISVVASGLDSGQTVYDTRWVLQYTNQDDPYLLTHVSQVYFRSRVGSGR